MSSLYQKLLERDAEKRPVKVALAGFGFIGRGALVQSVFMKGLKIVLIYARDLEKIIKTFPSEAGSFRICKSVAEVELAISENVCAITDQKALLYETENDVVLDATGDAAFAAEIALNTIMHHRHFIASAELDVCVGPYLSHLAQQQGVVYSGQDGDEPGVLMPLIDYVRVLGFEIIAAGKFKNYSNKYSNPETVKPWSDQYKQNPYKIASFADGTKMNIEMGTVCNAAGLVPDLRGMHNPKGTMENITDIIRLKEDGGILEKPGVIEIVQGVQPLGGVYVMVKTTHPQIMSDLAYYKMGNGPYYLFYKPYHIASVEVLYGVANAVINHEAAICPVPLTPKVDVGTFAKRDLHAGDVLDEIGGFDFYGMLDEWDTCVSEALLPVTLASGARLIRDIPKDGKICIHDVEMDMDTPAWDMRRKMG